MPSRAIAGHVEIRGAPCWVSGTRLQQPACRPRPRWIHHPALPGSRPDARLCTMAPFDEPLESERGTIVVTRRESRIDVGRSAVRVSLQRREIVWALACGGVCARSLPLGRALAIYHVTYLWMYCSLLTNAGKSKNGIKTESDSDYRNPRSEERESVRVGSASGWSRGRAVAHVSVDVVWVRAVLPYRACPS